MNNHDQQFGKAHRELTALLMAHPDVVERVIRLCQAVVPLYKRHTIREGVVAQTVKDILDNLPTDYFGAALARVADVWDVPLVYPTYTPKDKCYRAWLDVEGSDEIEVCAGSLREALQALWVALLALAVAPCDDEHSNILDALVEVAVEPCERCGGLKQITLNGIWYEDCPDCHGSGRKHPGIPDALVGSATAKGEERYGR
jgi:hypothetical protein